VRDRLLVVDGREVPVGSDVDHSLAFFAHSTPPRTQPPDLLVVHDTAGERDGAGVHETLAARGLSVEFVVGVDGAVWQYVDPARVYCWHAGSVNGRAVGIECVNSVFPRESPSRFANAALPLTGREELHGRPVLVDGYRGGKRRVLGHLPAQLATLRGLVAALLDAFPSVPRRLPRDPATGKVHGRRVAPGWAGVCGHLHLSDAHVDPAMDALYALDEDLPAESKVTP
jgi:N-acetyl-anhydromuramyl-L-alanine amidase AmpD